MRRFCCLLVLGFLTAFFVGCGDDKGKNSGSGGDGGKIDPGKPQGGA